MGKNTNDNAGQNDKPSTDTGAPKDAVTPEVATETPTDTAPPTSDQPPVSPAAAESNGSEMTAPVLVRPSTPTDPVAVVVLGRLDEYVKAMAPGVPMTPEQGARHQRALFTTLKMAMNLEGRAFNDAWKNILAKVNEFRKGAFHEKYAMRFLDTRHTGLSVEESRSFQDILHLALNTADPASRQLNLKSLSLESVASQFSIDNLHDKFVGFYHL